jgi:hypothetical protein
MSSSSNEKFNCEFNFIFLSEISGIDPEFHEILNEIDLNLPIGIKIVDWPTEIFMEFMNNHPIGVRKLKHGYQCISGIRQFKLAQSIPNMGQMKFPVVVYPVKLTAKRKMSLICSEIYLCTTVFRLRNGDGRVLVNALPKLIDRFPGLKEFDVGMAMGLDFRSYGKRTRKTI